jgi:hypothetical protein
MSRRDQTLNQQRAGSLDFLRRRIAHLTRRIEQAGPDARSFDQAERAALRLAIEDAGRCGEIVKVLNGPGTDAEKLAAIRWTLKIQSPVAATQVRTDGPDVRED